MATSIIRSIFERGMTRHRVGETNEILQEGATSMLTGGFLGILSAKLKTGLDVGGKFPIDIFSGVVGLVAPMWVPGLMAGHREVIRDGAMVALGIGTFRKTDSYLKGAKMHGEVSEGIFNDDHPLGHDPIVQEAANL